MSQLTEVTEEKLKVLIVSEKKQHFIPILKKEIEKYGAVVFISPHTPKTFHQFNYCFFINPSKSFIYRFPHNKKAVFIFINKSNYVKFSLNLRSKNIKIIDINGNDIRNTHIDTIFWFTFSQSKEQVLRLTLSSLSKIHTPFFKIPKWNFGSLITKKRMIILIFSLFIIVHTAFILPLGFSLYTMYQAYVAYKKDDKLQVMNFVRLSSSSLNATKTLYANARPTLLLFSLALTPDTIIDINEHTIDLINQSFTITGNIKEIQKLLFKKNKSSEERKYLLLRLENLTKQIQELEDNITVLSQKLPTQFEQTQSFTKQLNIALDGIQKIKKILPHLNTLLADGTEKKYLLFFANNMELRPGGGFLGSFGILKIHDYTIDDIEIHDVYDADGQLIAHIDPPEPIRKYLQIPHGFLRDSNFSPDFPENYEKAKMFLEKEINVSNFSGTILLTTTAIENIMDAFGNIYLSDFNETINKDNFYIKTQVHTEKGFFPGSTQKKTFLGSLARHLIINLDDASPKKMIFAIKKSLDEKQMVFYFDDPQLQKTIDPLYWSGRSINPLCVFPTTSTCIVDYIFPFDANVGANKVNFFINRSMYLKTAVNSQGRIQHVFSVQFRNDSPAEIFPGGTYKNYFQVLFPVSSTIQNITKDGTLIEDSKETSDRYKTVSIYFELLPRKTTEIKFTYTLNNQFPKGKSLYQLIVQKQIGSSNNDYIMQFDFSKSIHILNQNFAPLVKDNRIVYNTNLSADKIFFIELTKE